MLVVVPGISNSLGALIGKVISKLSGGAVKADVKGLKAEPGKSEKGAPLGDPGGHLLHGVGYGTKDARNLKNKAEEANVSRFLEPAETPKDSALKQQSGTGEEQSAVPEKKTAAQESREARDQDVRREDQKDEMKMSARAEAKEAQEEREKRDVREKERSKDPDERDEEEKRGHGWVKEEAEEEEEDPRRPGHRNEEEVYADNARCKGTLDDGTRCLRKPVKGIGYCREHSVNWRPDHTPKA
jgi:hypothetical protein